MTSNTDVHTCSYYCERPECVRRQRDELRERMEADQQPAAPSGEAVGDWVLVPRVPTDAMLSAAQSAWLNDTLRRTTTMWRAMLAAAPQQPVGVGGAKEADLWCCTVCGRVGTVGRCCGEETREPLAPPSAPVGVDFAAVASILRRAMRDGVHYGYRRDFILQQALALEALSQQPAAVDEAMVERAWVAFCENNGSARQGIRAALTAALATQRQEPKS